MEGDSLLMGVGIVSCICCLLPILTYALFPDLRNLRYIELVWYISANDLVATIGATLPRSPDGSFACWFQGLTTNFNFLSSALWTVIISYQLWLVTHHGVLLDDSHMKRFHRICWIIPLLATLLPLTTSTYGDSDDSLSSWCIIRSTPSSADWTGKVWTILGFYIWIWAAILVMVFYLSLVALRFRRMGESLAPVVYSSLHKLLAYPLIIFVCWFLPSIADMTYAFSDPSTVYSRPMRAIMYMSYLTPLLQGILLSLVFALRNPIVRDRWRVAIATVFLKCAPNVCNMLHTQASSNEATRSESSFCGSWTAKLRSWLARGDELVAVHIRAENESDYSSRASVASRTSTRSSSAWTKARRSILSAMSGMGGTGEKNDGSTPTRSVSTDSVGIDIIPPASASSSWPAAAMTHPPLLPPTSPSPLYQGPGLVGAVSLSPMFSNSPPVAQSSSPFGSYFSSGSLGPSPEQLSHSLSTSTSGSTGARSSERSSLETSSSEASGSRTGSGRLPVDGSPSSTHFSNSPSSRLGSGLGQGLGSTESGFDPSGIPENPILQRPNSARKH